MTYSFVVPSSVFSKNFFHHEKKERVRLSKRNKAAPVSSNRVKKLTCSGLSILLSLALSLPTALCAETGVERAVAFAEEMGLAAERQWRLLLHVRAGWLSGGQRSFISRGDFFISSAGWQAPDQELVATLRAFFEPAESGDEHALCRYPARASWLKNKLAGQQFQWPEPDCDSFKSWSGEIGAESATLIFPSTYLNNPASAFGHTLIRLDSPEHDERTRPLAYAANFAAHTRGENAIVYALKGLFGGYSGYFSVTPYYKKIIQYGDIESRDIWEYQLNLTPAEVRLMVAHLWELRQAAFSYYYFDENCSYYLLKLLEVVRPELTFDGAFPLHVIPVDTIRAAYKYPELFGAITFRPSTSSKLKARIAQSTPEEQELAAAVVSNRVLDPDVLASLEPESQAAVLDLASDYLDYIEARSTRAEKSIDLQMALLRRRSTLTASSRIDVPVPGVRPDEGHASARFAVGGGSQYGRAFYELAVRPAYHDLIDPVAGFEPGAAIELFGVTTRQYRGDVFRLEGFDLLNIASQLPRSAFFRSMSWGLHSGWYRKQFDDRQQRMVFGTDLALGYSVEPLPATTVYLLGVVPAEVSTRLDKGYALGGGGRAGIYNHLIDGVSARIEGESRRYMLGKEHTSHRLRFDLGVALGDSYSVRFGVGRNWELAGTDRIVTGAFNIYF